MKKANVFIALIILLSTSISAQVNLNSGLVAYYPFNGDVKDYSTNTNHGVLKGNPTLVADKDGNLNCAYKFNGNGDYINVLDHPSLRPDSAITVSAWVYCEDFTSWNIVVSKRAVHNGSPWNSYLLYAAGSAGTSQNWGFGVATSKTLTHFAIDPIVAKTKKWVHLVGIYERNPQLPSGNSTQTAKNVRVYVDCKLVKEEAASGDIYYTDSSLRIGMAIPGPSKQFFKGMIDDVRIYNRGLNDSEINALCTEKFVKATGLNKIENNKYSLYPNPSKGLLYINGADEKLASIEIFDVAGKLILVKDITDGNSITLNQVSTGIYYVKLLDKYGNSQIEKLIID